MSHGMGVNSWFIWASAIDLTLNKLVLDGPMVAINKANAFSVNLTGHPFTLNTGTIQTGSINNITYRHVLFKTGSLNGTATSASLRQRRD